MTRTAPVVNVQRARRSRHPPVRSVRGVSHDAQSTHNGPTEPDARSRREVGQRALASLGPERSDQQAARAGTSVVGAATATTGQAAAARGGELNASVARAAVRLHRSYVGRGPTRARAFFRD